MQQHQTVRQIITDFVEDLNYHGIILNLQHVDKTFLKERLQKDNLNKTYRLENAKYMYVENCDFNGEEIANQEQLKEFIDDEGFELYDLLYDHIDGEYYIIKPRK